MRTPAPPSLEASSRPVARMMLATERCVISVATKVGQTALARTRVPATSAAAARMSPTAACLDAVYAAV